MRTGTASAILSVLFLVGIGALLVESDKGATLTSVAYTMSSMTYPRILLGLMIPLCIAIAISSLQQPGDPLGLSRVPLVLTIVAFTALYIFAIQHLGFLPATIGFTLTIPIMLGYSDLRWLVPVGLIYSIVIWHLFNNVLNIILPTTDLIPLF